MRSSRYVVVSFSTSVTAFIGRLRPSFGSYFVRVFRSLAHVPVTCAWCSYRLLFLYVENPARQPVDPSACFVHCSVYHVWRAPSLTSPEPVVKHQPGATLVFIVYVVVKLFRCSRPFRNDRLCEGISEISDSSLSSGYFVWPILVTPQKTFRGHSDTWRIAGS